MNEQPWRPEMHEVDPVWQELQRALAECVQELIRLHREFVDKHHRRDVINEDAALWETVWKRDE